VPWPWQHSAQAPTSDPSSIIKMARSQAVTGRADTTAVVPPPSSATVRALANDLRTTAAAGYDRPVSAAQIASVRTTPGPYVRLGRVDIPHIGLNVSFGEGVFDKTLLRGPGHFSGTPMPGQEGNAVLSGHRNTHTAPFRHLNDLRHGDKIIVTMRGEKATTYRVTRTTIVPQAKYKDFVLRQPADPNARTITLFACHPEGNPIYRIVVQGTA
jgi:sortase A